MDVKKQFGQNVRKLRERKGWSQEDLSEYSGLHRTYISGIERGVRNPTIDIVQRVAVALGCRPSDLLKEER
ncbi:MAG: helix-turn-helix transcriptional regulator [Micavibrio aeruginosavorus]|uniref:Helix-turn-helix transcriptional regulator n=1 Tax=Micavibrio aeruginosavorus TaxID=349221 RepID=A0A7T5R387_9BACT|nr:MAG: helix-turn-helix transcriptional regulator [Micavibrio aeruginosavorus]